MRPGPTLIAALVVLSGLGCGQRAQPVAAGTAATASTASIALTDQVVEAGCAGCMFGLPNRPGCEAAIRVNGVVFLATGKNIPDAGDHATGMCDRIQQARVSGKTDGAQFVATDFAMLP